MGWGTQLPTPGQLQLLLPCACLTADMIILKCVFVYLFVLRTCNQTLVWTLWKGNLVKVHTECLALSDLTSWYAFQSKPNTNTDERATGSLLFVTAHLWETSHSGDSESHPEAPHQRTEKSAHPVLWLQSIHLISEYLPLSYNLKINNNW